MARPVLDPSRAGWAAFERRELRTFFRFASSPFRAFAMELLRLPFRVALLLRRNAVWDGC
jgi:hypothetical protein